jgi:threonine/homoserine/homoserine lactone efflux protein
VVGFGLGFFVALQLGPMSLFLIRTTLRGGLVGGVAIGAGIAVVDGLYAAAGAAGVSPLLGIQPLRLALGVIGATVLIGLGLRTLYTAFRVRLGAETPSEVATPRRAFLTSLAGTASNPLTIASWAAIFAAASTAGAARTTPQAVLVDAHAQAELEAELGGDAPVELDHRRLHAGGRPDRALGVILVGDRSAEHGHHVVADELVHPAAVLLHLAREPGQAALDERLDRLVVQALRHGRVSGHVGEQHRDQPPLLRFAERGTRSG